MQLPLKKGDGLFFNPALFHAAGSNTTESHVRMANLLQISSAFGVPMEEVSHEHLLKLAYPILLESRKPADQTKALIEVAARGYSFLTNLDTDPPVEGMVPKTQQRLIVEVLDEQWSVERFHSELDAQTLKRKA